MMVNNAEDASRRSDRACEFCQRRKKKCDRLIPTCSFCQSKGQKCQYSDSKATPGFSVFSTLGEGFPNTYFLDHHFFLHAGLTTPSSINIPLPDHVIQVVQNHHPFVDEYFSSTHIWMPILCRHRLLTALNPLLPLRFDIATLLFCIRLILWKPENIITPGFAASLQSIDDTIRETPARDEVDSTMQTSTHVDPRSENYLTAKRLLFDAENLGLLNLSILQAKIIVAIYELGHGIYPAAYMSVGACVRYGTALGIDKQRAQDVALLPYGRPELEERRRAWWMIIILDRMSTSSQPLSPDPHQESLLPINDIIWDEMAFDLDFNLPVGSPSVTSMGMLARLSQAAYLVGKVLRHNLSPTEDQFFNAEEKLQLDRTIRALLRLSFSDAPQLMPICPQTAMCFSALIMLHCSEDRISASDLSATRFSDLTDTLQILRPVANESYKSSIFPMRGQSWELEQSSPLLLQPAYHTALTFMRLRRIADSMLLGNEASLEYLQLKEEAEQGLEKMKEKLELLGRRWRVGKSYLDILNTREETSIFA